MKVKPAEARPRPGEGMFFLHLQHEGGEQPSPDGTDSSTSLPSSEMKSEAGATTRPRRARTTESR